MADRRHSCARMARNSVRSSSFATGGSTLDASSVQSFTSSTADCMGNLRRILQGHIASSLRNYSKISSLNENKPTGDSFGWEHLFFLSFSVLLRFLYIYIYIGCPKIGTKFILRIIEIKWKMKKVHTNLGPKMLHLKRYMFWKVI